MESQSQKKQLYDYWSIDFPLAKMSDWLSNPSRTIIFNIMSNEFNQLFKINLSTTLNYHFHRLYIIHPEKNHATAGETGYIFPADYITMITRLSIFLNSKADNINFYTNTLDYILEETNVRYAREFFRLHSKQVDLFNDEVFETYPDWYKYGLIIKNV